jgi:hypothetical protein
MPLTLPEIKIDPHLPENVFHASSLSTPVELLPYMIFTRPPAFQKYLAWAALGKVTVCVNVIVQAVVPEPVPEVFDVVPVNAVIALPEAAALPREVVKLVKSVFRLLRIVIVSVTTGATLDVIATPV